MSRPLRILVVDDNRDAVDSLAILLRLWGHGVEVAYDGRAGLNAALTSRPEAVLLDISMPMMHGGAVARDLRELPQFETAMIVTTTAHNADDPRLDEWREYFDTFLMKPYHLPTLEKVLATHAAHA